MTRTFLAGLCVLLSLWLNTSAQTFQMLYGDSTVNDVGSSILETHDDGFVIAGTQYDSGNQVESLFIIRTNNEGDTLWTRLIREPAITYSGSQVIETFDGGFAITGTKGGVNNFVPFMLKIDSSGNVLWNRSYLWFAQEHINSIVQTPDSGFLLSGYLYHGDMLVYFIRTNANGDTLWTKNYGELNFNVQLYSLKIAADGGFAAAGFIQNQFTQNVDAFLFKTDTAGNFLWAKGYGTSNYDYAQQLEVTADGGFALAAVTYSGLASADFCLIKTDSIGNLEWSKTYGGPSDDRSEAVHQTTDGGYLISGESASFSSGNFDNYMVRTDANGDTLWTKTVGGLQNNEGYSMIITDDKGFAVTGNYNAHLSNNDIFFLKTDSTGFMGCGEQSTNTVVDAPALNLFYHTLVFIPIEASVVAHALEVSSGTTMLSLCNLNFTDRNLHEEFILYPNPVTDHLFMLLNDQVKNVRIFNIYADEINAATEVKPSHCTIDCSRLIPGIYIVEIENKSGVSYQKFVKE